MNKKIALILLAFPLSGIVSYLLAVIYLVFKEISEAGFIDKHNASDQMMIQTGYLVIVMTFIIYGILFYLISRKYPR